MNKLLYGMILFTGGNWVAKLRFQKHDGATVTETREFGTKNAAISCVSDLLTQFEPQLRKFGSPLPEQQRDRSEDAEAFL